MNTNNIQETVEAFKKGKVVVFPTDTAYGIGCRMDDPNSVKRIFEIKKRDVGDALLVLVDSIEMAKRYVKFDNRSLIFVKKYWPGGLTVFLPCDLNNVPSVVRADTNILAVRWPDHKIIEQIIHEVGVPVVATSANISGESTPFSLEQVDKKILDQADFILPGECTYEQESTIIDCTVQPWKVVRKGAVETEI